MIRLKSKSRGYSFLTDGELRKKLRPVLVRAASKGLREETLELMSDGISPTARKKWPDYSFFYRSLIIAGKYVGKTISPVNLKLTGALHRSLELKEFKRSSKFVLRFTSKKATKHDKGLAGVPRRQLFPDGKQRLHINLRKIIEKNTRKALVALAKEASR